MRDEDAAYCAVAFAAGETASSLAQTFHASKNHIGREIWRWVRTYGDRHAQPRQKPDPAVARQVANALHWFQVWRAGNYRMQDMAENRQHLFWNPGEGFR